MNTLELVVGITIIAALTMSLSAFGLWKWWRWPKVTGVVVRYIIDNGSGGRCYFAIVRYKTKEGKQIVAKSSHGEWRRPWRRGDLISIRYNPTHPRWCEPTSFGATWGMVLSGVALIIWFGVFAWLWGLP
jgi:hypothetical protein